MRLCPSTKLHGVTLQKNVTLIRLSDPGKSLQQIDPPSSVVVTRERKQDYVLFLS